MRNELNARNPKTVRYGTGTIFFLSPKSCALIPQNICHKNIIDSSSLPCFKKSIRKSALETRLPMSFKENIFATCWFYIAQQQSYFLSF